MYRSSDERLIVKVLEYHNISFVYEEPLFLNLGYQVEKFLPDFTIIHPYTGAKYLWEHLGMIGDDEYDTRWEYKKSVYQSYLEQELQRTGKKPFELIETTPRDLDPEGLENVLRKMGFTIPEDLLKERYGFYVLSSEESKQLFEWIYGPPYVSIRATTVEEVKQSLKKETKHDRKRDFFYKKKAKISKEVLSPDEVIQWIRKGGMDSFYDDFDEG